MSEKITVCPKCMSTGEIISMSTSIKSILISNKCDLCNGKGKVYNEIKNDFILSINEDSINDNYD